MKKFLSVLMAALVMMTLTVSVFAAQNAFEPMEIDSETPDELVTLWDDPDTKDQGGSGQEIQKMDDYGVGYSSLNDQVIFKDVDFGENGADLFSIWFSFGSDDITTIDVHIDSIDTPKIASFEITNTGGWSKDCAEQFDYKVAVPGGVHDVIVVFTNSLSGSFAKIQFHEAPAPEVPEEIPEAEEPVDIAPAPVTPKTADAGVVAAVVVMAVAAMVIVKKH
ncbi:MAG: carbohydrate-binding protein [Clostridia bacterium]|nr:carbohydrate-binding protein [Clostridia bacterium]